MSDVLIKNIQIPKDNKRLALFIDKDGDVSVFEGNEFNRITDAIEVQPHGRLVDIDKMKLDFKATVVNCIEKDPNRADQYKVAERLVLGILKRTHNVIPASGETD